MRAAFYQNDINFICMLKKVDIEISTFDFLI